LLIEPLGFPRGVPFFNDITCLEESGTIKKVRFDEQY
jgi:hypothetical protein